MGVADEDRRLEHVGHASAETTVGRLEALGPLRRLAEHEQAPPRYLGEHEGRVDGLDGRLRVVADQSHLIGQGDDLQPPRRRRQPLERRDHVVERQPLVGRDGNGGEGGSDHGAPQELEAQLPRGAVRVQREPGPARPLEPHAARPHVVARPEPVGDDARVGPSRHRPDARVVPVEDRQPRTAQTLEEAGLLALGRVQRPEPALMLAAHRGDHRHVWLQHAALPAHLADPVDPDLDHRVGVVAADVEYGARRPPSCCGPASPPLEGRAPPRSRSPSWSCRTSR